MKHSVSHDIGQELAKKATVAAIETYQKKLAKYEPTANWVSDSRVEIAFRAKGVSLAGRVEVLPKSIEMDLDVPFLLRPFKGKALGVVEDHIRRWIGKAKAGEL